jgi:tetratricopeptide (TPR) repeat protein
MSDHTSLMMANDEELQAAQRNYQAAQAAFARGDDDSTVSWCRQALVAVQQHPTSEPHNRLCVEATDLLLEVARQRGAQHLSLTELLDAAETAAARAGDPGLQARIRRQHALLLLRANNRSAAARMLQEALALAEQAGDATLEFMILSELGHCLVGEDLACGLILQRQAYAIYETRLADTHADSLHVRRLLHALQARIGVNEFDLGNYDVALNRLIQSVEGMRHTGMRADLPWALNYLAQVYVATGRFEEAEAVLREAIMLPDDRDADPTRSNNLALLGKLYVEWERVNDADEPMRRGWAEAHAAWHVGLAPLVRNYYAELLMHPDYRQRDLTAAEEQLTMNLSETLASAFHRSEIQALSLRGRLALVQGNMDAALGYSAEAVAYLERMGTMPALRTEEILWNHACVLQAAGRAADARRYLEQAHAVVQWKAGSIADPTQRANFLGRVPLSREIVAAYKTWIGPIPQP